MGRDAIRDHVDFALMNVFTLVSLLRQPRDWKFLIPNMLGISLGLWKICSPKNHF
jgi:hypothetical protein